MNILLIGATGQIGFSLAQRLAGSEHQLTVLVRHSAALGFKSNVRIIAAEQFDQDTFKNALQGQDLVVYGIGLPEQFVQDADTFDRINHQLFATFLKALASTGIKRLIYISTYEVFEAKSGVIQESNPVANPAALSPYFAAMTRSFQLAQTTAKQSQIALTTIHPAAVYGGRNTGDGITHFIENILERRYLKIPTILKGNFPIVHADSLADAIVRSINHTGSFIVSEGMTSLKTLALEVRSQEPKTFIPPSVPKWMAYLTIGLLEAIAKIFKHRPILSVSQLDFITKGDEPKADQAIDVLGWQPLSHRSGVARYLVDRR